MEACGGLDKRETVRPRPAAALCPRFETDMLNKMFR
jgi:hypothetical protein